MGRFLLGVLAMQYTIIDVSSASTGPVVQLDRISDFGSEGWGSNPPGSLRKKLTAWWAF